MLGIYGDSFGDTNPRELINSELHRVPWPIILADMLGEEFQAHAQAATSIWWSYKNFLKTYKKYDTIIFCYSNQDRWPNINSLPYEEDNSNIQFGLSHVFFKDQLNMVSPEAMHLAEKLVDIHPYIYSEQLNIFLYQSLFNDINRICREEGIRLVNLLSFEEFAKRKMIVSIDSASGPCLTNLINISHNEFVYRSVVGNQLRDNRLAALETKPDRRFCHINSYNNKILATIIKESLDNNTKYLNLATDSRFSFDITHLEYLLCE